MSVKKSSIARSLVSQSSAKQPIENSKTQIQSNNKTKFGLYIHWPFCLKKCPYCDFNSYAFEYEPEIWVKTLLQEMEQNASKFQNYEIETIFFGGGTPSLISPKYIKELIDKAKSLWDYKNTGENDLEITIETNPSSIETHALEQFMHSGINRFSIGMQSLNDENLKFLGRLHSAKEAITIIKYAAKICDNVSGDFIYALPKDTLSTWKKDLDQILELATEINLKHCSLYQLTIEENTAFAQQVATKLWSPMDEDKQSILYRHTYETVQNNWDFYEISNMQTRVSNIFDAQIFNAQNDIQNVPRETSQEAKNYQSKHNLIYWRYQPYLGIGPGAHSRMLNQHNLRQKIKFHNIKSPHKWQEKVLNYKPDQDFFDQKLEYEELNEQEMFQEKALMGLRLKEGITIFPNEMPFLKQEKLSFLEKTGFIEAQQGENLQIRTTLNGRLCLNAVLKMLLSDITNI